jgi:hypothetical protein
MDILGCEMIHFKWKCLIKKKVVAVCVCSVFQHVLWTWFNFEVGLLVTVCGTVLIM